MLVEFRDAVDRDRKPLDVSIGEWIALNKYWCERCEPFMNEVIIACRYANIESVICKETCDTLIQSLVNTDTIVWKMPKKWAACFNEPFANDGRIDICNERKAELETWLRGCRDGFDVRWVQLEGEPVPPTRHRLSPYDFLDNQ